MRRPRTASMRSPGAVTVELLIVGCLLRAYDVVREHADLRQGPAIAHGRALLSAERRVGLDLEAGASRWTAAHHLLELASSSYYQYAHVTVTMTLLLWTWLHRPSLYRWARTSLVLVNLAGLTVFFLLPVAPPRLLPGAGVVDGAVTVGRAAVIAHVHADQYGAMPSLHVAWAVWVAVVGWQVLPARWRSPVALYPVLTAAVVVMTGNHYLLDIPAGAVVAALALQHRLAGDLAVRRRSRRVPRRGVTPATISA